MALRFKCSVCNEEITARFLRMRDLARCPNCRSFTPVPPDAEDTGEDESTIMKNLKEREPRILEAEEPSIIPRFRTALRFVWQVIKANFDVAIGSVAIYFAVAVASGLAQLGIPQDLMKQPSVFIIVFLIQSAIGSLALAGVTNISLGFAFDNKAKMRNFMATPTQYIRFFFGYIIYYVCTVIGLILFIIPGIVFAVTFQFYDFFILRYNAGILEAFRESAKLTSGYRLKLFGFDIATLLFRALGLLAFCMGIYITIPISVATLAYVFSILIKERGFEPPARVEPGGTPEFSHSEPPAPEIQGAYPTISQAILLVLIYTMLTIFVSSPFGIIEEFSDYPITDIVPLEILGEIVVIGLIIWFVVKKAGLSVKDIIILKPFNLWLLLPISMAISGVAILISEMDNILNYILREPPFFREMLAELRLNTIRYIALAVLLAPIAEEILFRGIIVRGFLRNYSVRKTIVVSALLFAVIHVNPWQIPTAFIGGIILAWIFIETRSLWPCFFAHALHNAFDLILTYLFDAQIPGFNYIENEVVIFQPWWFDLLGFVAATIGICWLFIIFRRGSDAERVGPRLYNQYRRSGGAGG